jgi:hypothetical protein
MATSVKTRIKDIYQLADGQCISAYGDDTRRVYMFQVQGITNARIYPIPGTMLSREVGEEAWRFVKGQYDDGDISFEETKWKFFPADADETNIYRLFDTV